MDAKTNPDVLRGLLTFHSETGTEGGFWAFQDDRYIFEDDQWSYEGLHVLKDGDRLTIFDKLSPGEVVWSGIIELRDFPVFTESVFSCWIHSEQIGTKREDWARWFFEEYPAALICAF